MMKKSVIVEPFYTKKNPINVLASKMSATTELPSRTDKPNSSIDAVLSVDFDWFCVVPWKA